MKDIPEIKLGTVMFSIVEPKPGHAREFHRWYERDHFFAGCMIGENYLSARRWVATRPLKALRFPADTPIVDDIRKGSYLVTYWIQAGTYEETLRWSVDQVLQLHKQNRMQPARDNVSTAFYQYPWGAFRDPDGVPPELALEHPYKGISVVMIDRADGVTDAQLSGWLRDKELPRFQSGSPVAMTLAFRPESLPDDAPKYVPRPDPAELDRRYLLLSFLEQEPGEWWRTKFGELERALTASRLGRVIYAAPFIPTVPGTDKYVDEL
ncbi:MAG TPA: hypothetical protein VKZ79_05360 [Alphaproteobacteria bacterium]|nr:hypothetical protein [Alphaproteobacteria bacterium]